MAMASRVSFPLFIVVFGLVASVFTGIYAEESESKEFVLTLDHSNFSDAVSKLDFVVVEFYAPWYETNLAFSVTFDSIFFLLIEVPRSVLNRNRI